MLGSKTLADGLDLILKNPDPENVNKPEAKFRP